ncbi:MAG TPA: hypothetical protein VNZ26_12985 [Vicinamibacterales bacterium]|nr:hypothetical protein [Vicinamibacterales bacterium]
MEPRNRSGHPTLVRASRASPPVQHNQRDRSWVSSTWCASGVERTKRIQVLTSRGCLGTATRGSGPHHHRGARRGARTAGLGSKELAQKVGETIFPTKTGFGFPKILLVEDDFDFTDVGQVVWAFATRAHPHHGEVYFENRAQNNLPVFLEPEEKFSYHTTKVVHNCLVADRFAKEVRPVAADLARGWPLEIQKRVLDGWRLYGYLE